MFVWHMGKRYPAYKAKVEFRNKIRRAQEKALLEKRVEKNERSTR